MEIFFSEEFKQQYDRHPHEIQKKFLKQKHLLLLSIYHPSLHTEKLLPKGRQVWSFRVDLQYRVSFRYLDNGDMILLTIGTHDWVYRRM